MDQINADTNACSCRYIESELASKDTHTSGDAVVDDE